MSQKGMTLVELMVVLVVASIIGTAVLNLFTVSSRTFMDQNKVIDVQREGRLVIDFLARALRETGLNPLQSANFQGVRDFNLGQITIDRDMDLDGILDDKELISFEREAVAGGGFILKQGFNLNGSDVVNSSRPIAKNIIDFRLDYFDETGATLGATDPASDIRSIDITLEFKDEKFMGGDFTRSYKTRIDLRNF